MRHLAEVRRGDFRLAEELLAGAMVRRAVVLPDAEPPAQSWPKARVLKSSEAPTLPERQALAQLAQEQALPERQVAQQPEQKQEWPRQVQARDSPLLAEEQAWAQLPEARVQPPVRPASAQRPPEAVPQERQALRALARLA